MNQNVIAVASCFVFFFYLFIFNYFLLWTLLFSNKDRDWDFKPLEKESGEAKDSVIPLPVLQAHKKDIPCPDQGTKQELNREQHQVSSSATWSGLHCPSRAGVRAHLPQESRTGWHCGGALVGAHRTNQCFWKEAFFCLIQFRRNSFPWEINLNAFQGSMTLPSYTHFSMAPPLSSSKSISFTRCQCSILVFKLPPRWIRYGKPVNFIGYKKALKKRTVERNIKARLQTIYCFFFQHRRGKNHSLSCNAIHGSFHI